MAEKKSPLTVEGRKNLEAEREVLTERLNREIPEKIRAAREQGDLSENAEYDSAMDEQRDIVARLEAIKEVLDNADIVVEEEVDTDRVSVGCKVRVFEVGFNEEMELRIVGSVEADSLNNKISNESPVGMALLGLAVGETAEVETPMGLSKYKVLEIGRVS
ncbi:MAG: transcription elongation factor GreA [Lachnospiraceae bacterium]|jgi:transcription elongation factor GreA|nr:transcription elongation factor GreA [Lachnospiraceae bacterium]